MSDAAPAVAVPAKKKAAAKPKVAPAHPKYKDMIIAAITALKERGGSSRQAIVKYITANYEVGDNTNMVNSRVKAALKAGVAAESFKQVKGTGAAGSFRMGEKKKAAPKKPASPKKKAAPKKAAVKKPAAAKKSPKKPAAKKPAAAKKTAAAKKPAAKKPAAKKPAAKKPAAKKAAAAKKSPKKPAAKKPAAKKAAAKK